MRNRTNSCHRRGILLLLVGLAGLWPAPCVQAAQSITQWAITWTFDRDYPTGQFANGDYWVVGPVTIVQIDPPSTQVGSHIVNGSMINPRGTMGAAHGYDNTMRNGYQASLNKAWGVSPTNPLVVQPHSSLISVVSNPNSGALPQLTDCSILTVLPEAPPPGSFRPAYTGIDKTIRHNKSDLNYEILPNLPQVASMPPLSEIADYFERPWIDHIPLWEARYMHPSNNMPDYGREMALEIGTGALALLVDNPVSAKEELMIRYVQLGIDFHGIIADGGRIHWKGEGGHASGRKWPIIFAGLALGDADMANIGFAPSGVHFGEDDQTYYGQPTVQYPDGKALWGQDCTDPNQFHNFCIAKTTTSGAKDCRDPDALLDGCEYRICCTSHVWVGYALAARIMGAKALWNHDSFFDYVDRWILEDQAYGNNFIKNMWLAYRDTHGGEGPVPTLPPTHTPGPTNTPGPPTKTFTPAPTATPAPTLPPGQEVYRVNVGGSQFTDSQNHIWQPEDAFFTGSGFTYSQAVPIAGTVDDAIYQSECWDSPGGANMVAAFPLSPGLYSVRLHFAEVYSGAAQVGKRVFDVVMEGQVVLDNYDIFASVGYQTADVRTVQVQVNDGTLNIEFLHGVENPKVNGIEILTVEQGPPATATPPPTATRTFSPVPTHTPPPTATHTTPPNPTATHTPIPPTATSTAIPPTATNTAVPPTATNTGLPPTATYTAVPPTATNTPLATATNTAPPTATFTSTPAPTATATSPTDPTATASATPPPLPTATPTVVVEQGGTIGDLSVTPAENPGGYRLTFTSPDMNVDTPAADAPIAYDIRYSVQPINEANFSEQDRLPNIPDALPTGRRVNITIFSLPAGPLHFAARAIGLEGAGPVSSSVSASASGGSAVWARPLSRKTGIELLVGGEEFQDFVLERHYFDTADVDDRGVLYLRGDTELKFTHNSKNVLPAPYWSGGQSGVTANHTGDFASLAGMEGKIRYRFDADRLWEGVDTQAYVVDGEMKGVSTFRDHPMIRAFSGQAFTPKSFYEAAFELPFSRVSERTGENNGAAAEERFSRGYLDPDTGEEWHELAYWDDDRGWLSDGGYQAQASDGKRVWVMYAPKAPVPHFSAQEGGRFFTTRPKAYYQGKIHRQTTYYSGPVTLTLASLSDSESPLQYRFGGGNWSDYQGPIDLSNAGPAPGQKGEIQMRLGETGVVRSRYLVHEPDSPSAGEVHPTLLFNSNEKESLLARLRSDLDFSAAYESLKTEPGEVPALLAGPVPANERAKPDLGVRQSLSAALLAGLEADGTISGLNLKADEVRDKALGTLISLLAMGEPLGDESAAGKWATPSGERAAAWDRRGERLLHAALAYDALAGVGELDPIEELKLRELLAEEANLLLRFASRETGRGNFMGSVGLAAAAYAMPSYDSPVFGGATSTAFADNPFAPGLSWMDYVEREDLAEGQSDGPRYRSAMWKLSGEEGLLKRGAELDADSGVCLSYFLNLYARFYGADLLAQHPELARGFEFSLRTRQPWDRNMISYGKATATSLDPLALVLNNRFASTLDLPQLRWHLNSRGGGFNPSSAHPWPLVLAWCDPTIVAQAPAELGTRAYSDAMVFQSEGSHSNSVQLVLRGREKPSSFTAEGEKDDTTGIFLNAFGERFLANTDSAEGWMHANAESQNVILVDDTVAGPVDAWMAEGPSRSTVARMTKTLAIPGGGDPDTVPPLDYGCLTSQIGSLGDLSYYGTKVRLNRHVAFVDRSFFVILDDLEALDNQFHTYGWTGHCMGNLSLSNGEGSALFTKPSGRKLLIDFAGPVGLSQHSLTYAPLETGAETQVPYFIAERQGKNAQFLATLLPVDNGQAVPTVEDLAVARGTAMRLTSPEASYLMFAQVEPNEAVTVDGKLSTTAKLAIAKEVAGTLEYVFVVDQTGPLSWNGGLLVDEAATRSYAVKLKDGSPVSVVTAQE